MKKWISEICHLLLSHFNLDQTLFCKNEFVYGKPVRRKLHPIISPCKYEMFYWKEAVHLYHAAVRHSVKNYASCLAHCEPHYTESRSGWPKCSRSIYHKEMYTTNMTFAAPSLQLRSNTFFHSYEFDWQKASFKQVFEIILSNRNFLLKRRSPFVLCHNGWHFKYWRCKNDSLYDSVDVFAFLYANYSTRCILAIL